MLQINPLSYNRINRFLPCLILLVCACIEPFDFRSIGFDSKLVVDASLTNEAKEHVVKLSYTFPLDTNLNLAASNAAVAFIEASGNRVPLRETSPGHYVTNSDYAGIPGQSYQLSIVLPDGKEFLSDSEVMRDPVPIDSVFAEYTSIPVKDLKGNDFTGVQIFVNANSDADEPHSFRYDYVESYEVPVPFPSAYDWSGSGEDFQLVERPQPLGTCYRVGFPSSPLLATTRGLIENRVFQFRVRFISEYARELAYQYIIAVRQLTISNDAYTYFKQLRESNESQGSLSDEQLGTMPSNIKNVNDSLDLVLGYFEVAGVTEVKKRLSYHEFLDEGIQTEEWICEPHPLLPDPGAFDFNDNNCFSRGEATFNILIIEEDFIISRDGDTTFFTTRTYDWSALDFAMNSRCSSNLRITSMSPAEDQVSIAHYLCSDCTTYGTLERPPVWED